MLKYGKNNKNLSVLLSGVWTIKICIISFDEQSKIRYGFPIFILPYLQGILR